MAFQVGAEREDRVLSDINVTPLVDVMLVLLIIFMIAAPMLHRGIEVALPQAEAENLPVRVEDPIVLTIRQDGLIFIRDVPVHPSQLAERLVPQLKARSEQWLLLKGDREVPYGKVVEVLDILHQAGIEQIGMVTERATQTASGG